MGVRVRVPASAANLGPGFDAMGLAFDWYDEIELVLADELGFDLSGEGADDVPRDEGHLVVSSLRVGLTAFGHPDPGVGVHLRSHGTIPHARGLGSSAAAIVAGLGLAWGLTHPRVPVDRQALLELASVAEGHPDNAAAAVFGGVVLAWMDATSIGSASLRTDPRLGLRVWIPDVELPTHAARLVLPETMPRAQVIAQAATAALLVHALDQAPHLLHRATQDWMHQQQRGPLMPRSHDLLTRLRADGVAAVVSGAGPSLLALGTAEQLDVSDQVDCTGFRREAFGLGRGVQVDIFEG